MTDKRPPRHYIPKQSTMEQPLEKHDTAAWANIDELKPVSNVTIPDELAIADAKEWVETNQK